MMRVLGLIPARGGSKGVPGKNIRPLCGKPLLAYTAESALAAETLSRVVLSTDDEAIAGVGRELGLEVPFMRPAELAQDASPTLPVVRHALMELAAEGDDFDAVCLLQPTNPLRRRSDIDGSVRLLIDTGADSVVSVLAVPHEYNPHWVYLEDEEGFIRLATGGADPVSRRQDLPGAFHRDGTVYVTRSEVVLEAGSLYGNKVRPFRIDPEWSVNIDTEDDWNKAERLLESISGKF